MDNETAGTKLSGFGFQLLENVDPNPENFVCAAIFHSRKVQVGCLLRLEPNKQAQVCQYTCTNIINCLTHKSLFFFVDVSTHNKIE